MQIEIRFSLQRFLSFTLAAVAVACVALPATAQRAPELLPAQVTLIAGGGTVAYAAGATCPSGLKSTDAAGDGCLASEVLLGTGAATPGPRYAVADSNGNVFFSDYANSLIRRVDAITGVITAVAGGASSNPNTGSACGTGISVDALGDGCLGTSVQLLKPMGLAFAPNGDLYFSESDFSTSSTTGGAHVRKIAATGGFITTTGTISLVLGQASNAKGYAANNSTTCTATVSTGCVTAANSYLFLPYQLSTDTAGNLYISEEYSKNAVLVYNPTTSFETISNVAVPAGTIAKIYGAYGATSSVADCPNSPATTNGCSYGKSTFGVQASTTINDGVYGAAPDRLGNVYAAGEYYDFIGKIASTGVLTQFAGTQGTSAKNTTRATAGTNAIGSPFGIATDADSNVYFTDALNGVIFRVDADTSTQYVIAGGASSVCAGATDANGDGCAATSATFGSTGTSFASTALPGPGIYGVSVDAYGNLYTGDTVTNTVRKVGTGAQFGVIGSTQPTNILLVHFAPGDGPASSTPYVISAGMNNFALGTPGTCTVNSDGSTDCSLPLQATPTLPGAFSGTLKVTSKLGKTASFPLSGTYVLSRVTRVTLSFSPGITCAGSTTYSTSSTLSVKATITSSGNPTGTVQFYNKGIAIGSPVNVASDGTATLSQTFPLGSYVISATYSGDTNFNGSSTTTSVSFSTSAASFSFASATTPFSTVSQGGTALYSFTVPQVVYAGTITFSCSGLPAGASCAFSPAILKGSGCSTTSANAPVVALNINTAAPPTISHAGFSGRWLMLSGFLLAMFVGFGRRRMPTQFAQLTLALAFLLAASGLTACSTSSIGAAPTPKGTSTITVTGAGSDGSVQSTTVTLTVQ